MITSSSSVEPIHHKNSFIRSIKIVTHKNKLLVHEGEIELRNSAPKRLIHDNRPTNTINNIDSK